MALREKNQRKKKKKRKRILVFNINLVTNIPALLILKIVDLLSLFLSHFLCVLLIFMVLAQLKYSQYGLHVGRKISC